MRAVAHGRAGRRGFGRGVALQFVQGFHQHEHGKRDNQKADHRIDEQANVQRHRASFFGGFDGQIRPMHRRAFFQHDKQLRKIHIANQQANRRHDDVVHQRFDDGAKRAANHHTDGQINHIAAHGEGFELFKHAASPEN